MAPNVTLNTEAANAKTTRTSVPSSKTKKTSMRDLKNINRQGRTLPEDAAKVVRESKTIKQAPRSVAALATRKPAPGSKKRKLSTTTTATAATTGTNTTTAMAAVPNTGTGTSVPAAAARASRFPPVSSSEVTSDEHHDGNEPSTKRRKVTTLVQNQKKQQLQLPQQQQQEQDQVRDNLDVRKTRLCFENSDSEDEFMLERLPSILRLKSRGEESKRPKMNGVKAWITACHKNNLASSQPPTYSPRDNDSFYDHYTASFLFHDMSAAAATPNIASKGKKKSLRLTRGRRVTTKAKDDSQNLGLSGSAPNNNDLEIQFWNVEHRARVSLGLESSQLLEDLKIICAE